MNLFNYMKLKIKSKMPKYLYSIYNHIRHGLIKDTQNIWRYFIDNHLNLLIRSPNFTYGEGRSVIRAIVTHL